MFILANQSLLKAVKERLFQEDTKVRDAISNIRALTAIGQDHNQTSSWVGMKHALLAVIMFSLTVPFTEMALVNFSPESIAFVRAGLAGIGSLFVVLMMDFKGRWRLPNRNELKLLLPAGFVVCLVFPYTLSVGLQSRSSTDMGVLLAGIPLITAIAASVFFSERHGRGFWLSVLLGTTLLVLFNLWSGTDLSGWFEALIIVLSAAVGYSIGGRVAKTLGGWQTICWMCILYLPISLLGAGYYVGLDAQLLQAQQLESGLNGIAAWNEEAVYALLYLALVSQWLGFHFWYGAMAEAGIAKVGQVQLTQPFFTLLFSVWLLGDELFTYQIVFAVLICMSVLSAIKQK